MKNIILKNSELLATVDEEDFERLNKFSWLIDRYGYAATGAKIALGTTTLHRAVLGLKKGDPPVDHINRDRLDCRKQNLRISSPLENSWNTGISKANSTGFKGVCFDKGRNKYVAHIHTDGRSIKIGRYNTAIEASKAYEEKVIEMRHL